MLLAFSFLHFSPWQLAFLFKDQALYVLILLRCHFPCYGTQVLQLSNMILQWNTCIIFANISTRAVEIPCPTCPTWSHFVQDKLKISIYLSLDKCGVCIKLIKTLYFTFLFIIMSSHVALKTVWIPILILWSYTVYKRVDIFMVSCCFQKCNLFKHRKV